MPNNSPECTLSPEAERDLESIWFYTFDNWGVSQADRYIDEFSAVLDQLSHHPNLGASCDHIRENYRRFPFARHVIYYRDTEFGISVVRILHQRMSPIRHL